jgi:hypothetical protein
MSRRRRSWSECAFLGALVVTLTVNSPARAGDAATEDALAAGIALRREHRDAEALLSFRRAYAIDPSPQVLAQVALAEAAVGEWVTGEADLLRALASDDPWIASRRAQLQIALAEINGHLATLEVDGPDGSELWVDGLFAAKLPMAFVRVPAKHLMLELRAKGFAAARRELDTLPRARERVTFVLEPLPPAPTPAPPAPLAPPPVRPAAQGPSSPAGAPGGSVHPGGGLQRAMAWGAGAAAVGFLGLGVALTAYEFDRAGRYNGSECDDMATMPRSVRCGSVASQFRAAQIGAAVSYSLAGAAAVTSGLLFVTLYREKARGIGWRWRCAPAVPGVWCGATF